MKPEQFQKSLVNMKGTVFEVEWAWYVKSFEVVDQNQGQLKDRSDWKDNGWNWGRKEMKTEGLLQVCKGQLLVFSKDFKQNSDTI